MLLMSLSIFVSLQCISGIGDVPGSSRTSGGFGVAAIDGDDGGGLGTCNGEAGMGDGGGGWGSRAAGDSEDD